MSEHGAIAEREPQRSEQLAGAPRADEAPIGALPDEQHLVQFYDDDVQLSLEVSQFLADGHNASDTVIAIASAAHREAFQQRLTDLGFDVSAAIRGVVTQGSDA